MATVEDMSASQTIRVDASMTDDEVRVVAGSIGLGDYLTTAKTGIGRRVLMFEQGVIERRKRSISVCFDGLCHPEPAVQTPTTIIYSAAS